MDNHCVGPPLLLYLFLLLLATSHAATDRILLNQTIADGQTLFSSGAAFALGFFTPSGASPAHRYLGIWYNRPGDLVVIWVANGQAPIEGTTGVLRFNATGALELINGSSSTVLWSSTPSTAGAVYAELQNSGNLAVVAVPAGTVWQSFDEPSNMLIPMAAVYIDLAAKRSRGLVAWRSSSDPSAGNFTQYLRSYGSFVQAITYKAGSIPYWRTGPWVGLKFVGIPNMRTSYAGGFTLNRDNNKISLQYAPSAATDVLRLVLAPDGKFVSWRWDAESGKWVDEWRKPENECDEYNTCGAFGVCDPSLASICHCLRGFRPRDQEEWGRESWTGGCVRDKELGCGNGSSAAAAAGFLKVQGLKLPDLAQLVVDLSNLSQEQCEERCLNNCSCLAYAYVDGTCMVWGGDLLDMMQFDSGGEDLYIKLEASELIIDRGRNNKKRNLAIILVILVVISGLGFALYYYLRKGAVKQAVQREVTAPALLTTSMLRTPDATSAYGVELPDFTYFLFDDIVKATNDFCREFKLGEGGFGSVYKGVLPTGREIAVKRLCGDFSQGLSEFRNEVMLISQLQHRNLVKLLGCCVNEEKLLVYEFMPNKSLDTFLFGPEEQCLLDWLRRYHIIEGVAHGLLYLHRDSGLKIIHRDLKASNVLLDAELNAKIADFGTARIFYGNEIQAKTRRVVGTYGYMSPEYAMHGQFSEKSDVFSFGVLVLEIVSGKRIGTFYHEEYSVNLLGYAWKQWKEEDIEEFIDPRVRKLWPQSNAMKCVLIALLCVQELLVDRPNMSHVVSMLTSNMDDIQEPRMPSFIGRRDLLPCLLSGENGRPHSVNRITLTRVEGR